MLSPVWRNEDGGCYGRVSLGAVATVKEGVVDVATKKGGEGEGVVGSGGETEVKLRF